MVYNKIFLGFLWIDSSSTAQDDHIKGASSRNSSPVNNTSVAKLEPLPLLESDTRPDGLEPQAGPSFESDFDSSRRGGKSGLILVIFVSFGWWGLSTLVHRCGTHYFCLFFFSFSLLQGRAAKELADGREVTAASAVHWTVRFYPPTR